MPTGTVKWFDPRQGYGYIVPDDGGPEACVHRSQLPDEAPLQEGQRVAFALRNSPKGPVALAVRAVEPGPPTPL